MDEPRYDVTGYPNHIIETNTSKTYTMTETANLLNTLTKENKQLLKEKNHLMGYLIKIKGFDDEDIDAILNRETYEYYGQIYYSMKEDTLNGIY